MFLCPTAGYRSYVTAAIASVGVMALVWSPSVSDVNGLYLYLDNIRVFPALAYPRSHGFSVRCLHI